VQRQRLRYSRSEYHGCLAVLAGELENPACFHQDPGRPRHVIGWRRLSFPEWLVSQTFRRFLACGVIGWLADHSARLTIRPIAGGASAMPVLWFLASTAFPKTRWLSETCQQSRRQSLPRSCRDISLRHVSFKGFWHSAHHPNPAGRYDQTRSWFTAASGAKQVQCAAPRSVSPTLPNRR
jgi:hypothetical protein